MAFRGRKESYDNTLAMFCLAVCVQLCLTLCSPVDCTLPGPLSMESFQERMMAWIAISSSRESFRPRIKPMSLVSPALAGIFFTTEPPGKPTLAVPPKEVWRQRRSGFNPWVGKIPWRRA